MYRAILIALTLCVTGCASLGAPPENLYRIQQHVNERFTYVPDLVKWGVVHKDEGLVTGEERFTGDCEEYATATKYQLEKAGFSAKRWMVRINDARRYGVRGTSLHAVTCTDDGWCLDNITRIPQKQASLQYTWIRTL